MSGSRSVSQADSGSLVDDELERELEKELLEEDSGDEAEGGAGAADKEEEDEEEEAAASQPSVDQRQQAELQRKRAVMASLTEEQLDRYEAFRRSALSRKKMRQLLHACTGQAPNFNTLLLMCGITKLFVGDLVETAKEQALAGGHTGPLLPSHIHAAFQALDAQGAIPHRGAPKRPRLR